MARGSAQVSLDELGLVRTSLRLSVTEMAKRANVSRSTATKAEAGKPIEAVTALKLVDSLMSEAETQERPEEGEDIKRIERMRAQTILSLAPGTQLAGQLGATSKVVEDLKKKVGDFRANGHHQYLSKEQLIGLSTYLQSNAEYLRKFADKM